MVPWGRGGPRRFCCWRGRGLDPRLFHAADEAGLVNAIPHGLCYWKIRRRSAVSPGLSSSCFAMAIQGRLGRRNHGAQLGHGAFRL